MNAFKLATAGAALLGLAATADVASAQGRDNPVVIPPVSDVTPGCGTSCPGGHTPHRGGDTTVNQTNKTRMNVLVMPNMAMSSGWCQDNISVVLGAGWSGAMASAGIGKSEFKQLCGQWYAIAMGAGGNHCVPATTSVLMAGGYKAGDALNDAVAACGGQVRRRGPQLN